jgi:hypothetical protein
MMLVFRDRARIVILLWAIVCELMDLGRIFRGG